jgi:hypothetical protein
MTRLDPEVEAALRRAKRIIMDAHRDDPNVTGAGIGFRFRGGQWTDEPVVTVLVARKRPAAMLSRARLLPATVEVDGKLWGVDVVEGGPFKLHHAPAQGTARDVVTSHPFPRDARRAELARKAEDKLTDGASGLLTGKVRPPRQGCSISNLKEGKVAGTLGCFVRDPTDNKICLLSCNHVLARLNEGKPGEVIIQPGGLDGGVKETNRIAKLKRFAPVLSGTEVDGAIAELDDQSGYTIEVMHNLMAPISPTHPAVGMVVAGDAINGFLTRMDATLAALNVEVLGSTPPHGGVGTPAEVHAPEVGMNIQKVGRTTGYTSATILGIGFDINVATEGPLGTVEYDNLTWVMFFELPGDSGSVACEGGNGNVAEVILFLTLLAECDLLGAVSDYYDIPVKGAKDNKLADELRDNFLAQTRTGRLLIDLTYMNSQVVIDRLKKDTGPKHLQSMQRSHAQLIYSKYHELAEKLVTGKSPHAVVTESEIATVNSIVSGLGECDMLTSSESEAASALAHVVARTKGMDRKKVLAYMNRQDVFLSVFRNAAACKTLKLVGSRATLYDDVHDHDGE